MPAWGKIGSERPWRRYRRALRSIIVFTFVSAVFAAIVPVSAFACIPSGGSVAVFWKRGVSQNNGLYSYVYVPTSGTVDWSSGGFIGGAIWEAVANSTAVNQYMVEVGWTHGWEGTSVYTYYWARDTWANGYAEHKVNNVHLTPRTWMPMEILYGGSSTWNVYLNFVKATSSDGSTANIIAGPYSQGYSGGLESTNIRNWSGTGYWNYLEDYKNGSWTSSLDPGGQMYCDGPSTSSWVTPNVELQAAW